MSHSPSRRTLLLAAASAPFAIALHAWAAEDVPSSSRGRSFSDLEHDAGGRLGVHALDTSTGRTVQYRAQERFPFCSTSKTMICAAVLARSVEQPAVLQQRITYDHADVTGAGYAPVTQTHLSTGMTVTELCAAAIEYSDNAAANLLIKLLGGSSAVTAFARSIGDREFRLDRLEPELNSAIPGDARDTTTPAAMTESLRRLTLGHALRTPQQAQLVQWLRHCTTGDKRIRAGLPARWQAGDKTGTGEHGTTNDVAVLWPPASGPIVLTVYYTQRQTDAQANDQVIASATRIVLAALQRA